MKKSMIVILAVLVFQLANSGTGIAQITEGYQNARYEEGKTQALFNGENLDGWYVFLKDRGRNNDPKNVFTVQDGMIRITGEEWGCITTNKNYKNYKLAVEFKWEGGTYEPRKDKTRDSGVLLHS